MSDDMYDTAQVCLSGHRITSRYETRPEYRQDFCTTCGQKTITACANCGAKLRGSLHEGWGSLSEEPIPAYCRACGRPYPWTEALLKAARELADEMEELSADEREQLKNSLDDLVSDTPRTGLAVVRFKKLVAKAGQAAAQGMKQILVSVATEAAKKLIWPS
jgi:hypothetical protein